MKYPNGSCFIVPDITLEMLSDDFLQQFQAQELQISNGLTVKSACALPNQVWEADYF
jgi:hypothetical protein